MGGPPRGSLQPPPVAVGQAGVFTLEQAIGTGYSARQVRQRLADEQWWRVAGRGLTAGPPASGPVPWQPRELAWAAHLTWPDAVIGYCVAGALHGFPVDVGPGAEVHVIRPVGYRPLRGVVQHCAPLAPGDLARLSDGLPVTSRLRTAVDCLAVLDEDDAWSLLAWLVTRGRLPRAHLTEHLTRRTGRAGTAQLRRLHAATVDGALSLPERRLHDILGSLGLTGWAADAAVYDADGLIGRVDVLFAEARLVLEVDGFSAHSSRAVFEHDRRRQNRLVNAGYRVLRFTWQDLSRDPERVARQILEALAA